MKKVAAVLLTIMVSGMGYGDILGGDDFDDGTENPGYVPVSRTFNPDNSASNGMFNNGSSSFFDRFGIATIDEDGLGDSIDLPFGVVDSSISSFPGDNAGIIPESKTDHVFVATDLENSNNPTSPMGTASWTFDVSNHSNLSVSIDMASIGDFGTDGRGNSDRFEFYYQIDGGAPEPLMDIDSSNDGQAYVVTMLDGGQYLTGSSNFFFAGDDYNLLGCIAGVPNSCQTEVDVFGDGSTLIRPDASLDADGDGHFYVDPVNFQFTDTPTDPADPTVGALRTYEETNGSGTYSQPEVKVYRNILRVNGDNDRPVTNQLSTFTESISGTGDTLTLFLAAEQYGGDEYFVFDNILIEGTPTTGGGNGDFNSDGVYDCADVDALVSDIANSLDTPMFDLSGDGSVDATDLTMWLAEAGNANLGAGLSYLPGDANLSGAVDVSDYSVWLANRFQSTGAWCQGDFNADGSTDVSDLSVWTANKFSVSGLAVVPEPTSFVLLLFSLLGLLRFRR